MGKQKLKLKNWPFEKGEKAQLIWIGEPFKENNKWMIDTYFSDGKSTRKVIQDWANIHFLSIDKYYIDGDLRSGEIIDTAGIMSTIDIELCGIIPKYNEGDWNIAKSNYKSKSKTFNFWKNNVLYTVPIVEIVRAVLAPNTFMLNTILYNDVWEDYFTYDIQDRRLQIAFSNEYKTSYLKSEYYNHLAWMISNDEILKMCNEIGYNMFSQGSLRFDFNMTSFNIKARVKKNRHGFTIMEIVKVNLKEIKVDEIEIYHPSFEDRKKSDEAKLRTYTYLNNKSDDRIVDNKIDGANNFDESINEELITHEYINMPKVKKEKTRIGNLRINEDNNTKKYIMEDDNLRTLSSEGGMKRTNGIEFSEVDERTISAEFKSFILNLKQLERLDWIRKVNIKIVNLPLGRKFSYLGNGIDRRRCVIAEIIKINGDILGIIEVEREARSLSTLILKDNIKDRLQWDCEELLNGLVRKNGRWSRTIINNIMAKGIVIKRIKHIGENKYDNMKYISMKIYQL
ncbi:Tn7-like element transposition protein TnsE [Clostridium butyricum]|uniref:Tn7-like element transposition protein TnsE n=1 Tax=Clostridium butyricum TaxID=1492 RepID=UPI001F5652C5|nr:Tn7-like element transposition protein TnsE [Clostridium butyricum]